MLFISKIPFFAMQQQYISKAFKQDIVNNAEALNPLSFGEGARG